MKRTKLSNCTLNTFIANGKQFTTSNFPISISNQLFVIKEQTNKKHSLHSLTSPYLFITHTISHTYIFYQFYNGMNSV